MSLSTDPHPGIATHAKAECGYQLTGSILNRRHWEPLVGPPPLAPPPGAPGGLQAPSLQSRNSFNSAANLNTQMGGLSLGGGNGKEKEKEKGSKLGFGRLFKKS